MENEMASELNVLARDMARLARQNPRTADFTHNLLRRAIKELIACFPVYRTYLDSNGELDEADQHDLSRALAQASRNETEIDPSVFSFLEQVLTGNLMRQPHSGFSRQSLLRCAMRLQQYSGPVDAKGMEDTAFYRYNRFIALNEVGGDPEPLRRHRRRLPSSQPAARAALAACDARHRHARHQARRGCARATGRAVGVPERMGASSCPSGRASCADRRPQRRRGAATRPQR